MGNFIETSQEQFDVASAQRTLFKNVYAWMALALVVTGLTAYYVANSPTILGMIFGSGAALIGLCIAQFALVIGLSAAINKISFTAAGIMFVVYSILTGITLSSILLVYTSESVALTFFVTAGTFGAMALYGTVTNKDLSGMGSILFMALIGLIIASVANWFFHSSGLAMIISYAGVLIFVGLTAYDAQKIKNMLSVYGSEVNEASMKIALMGSLELYLDFINLFLHLIRILGSRRN
ncbi:MAG: Bax inhibitor-1/YccA family protein [Paludibacteraceae bacterium]|nr:Bax inhibitor-1/YccA family protein [Paludibacteraceae bacterium]